MIVINRLVLLIELEDEIPSSRYDEINDEIDWCLYDEEEEEIPAVTADKEDRRKCICNSFVNNFLI